MRYLESGVRVTWTTSAPILVFLGFSVLDLGPWVNDGFRQIFRQRQHAWMMQEMPEYRALNPNSTKGGLFDLLWICCTTSCTTNPRQIHNKSKCCTTNPRQIDRLQQIHNISTCRDVVDLLFGFVVQQIRVHNKSTTNRSNGVWIRFVVDLL